MHDSRQVLLAFLFGRACVGLTNSMLTVAIGWHLYERSGDPFDLALVGLMQIIPIAGLFFVSGLLVDTLPRRTVLIIATLIDVTAFVALALLLSADYAGKAYILSLLLVHGAARAFVQPAQQAALPNLVDASSFPRAVALSATTQKVSTTLGPLIAGVSLAWVDHWTYWFIALLSIGAVISYAALPRIAPSYSMRRSRSDVTGGVRFIRRSPIVFGAIVLDLFAVLFGSVMGLLPVYAIDILGVGPDILGVMRSMPAVGGVIAGVLLAQLPPIRRAGVTLFWVLGLFSLSILVFGLSTNLFLSLAALFVYGAVDMVSVNIRLTLIQVATPDELRGRVSAVNSLFTSSSNELGDFRAGSVAALIGPVPAVVIGGLTTLGVTLFGWVRFEEIRRLDRLDQGL